jgi:hypothetical protein
LSTRARQSRGLRVAGTARSYRVFLWARASLPLAVVGAGHARENGLFLPIYLLNGYTLFCHCEERPFLSFRGSPLSVIPRSAATRNLLEFCTVFRRIADCRFLTTFGMTGGKGHCEGHPFLSLRGSPFSVIARVTLFCHCEERPFFVIPRSAATRNLLEFCTVFRRIADCRFLTTFGMTGGKGHCEERPFLSFRGASLFCHCEERSDEESPRVLHRLPPYSRLQIPHCVRNDRGKGSLRGSPFSVIARSVPFLSFRGASLFCHSEERSDEESPRVLHRLPPYCRLQIPHCVRNDRGEGSLRGSPFSVIPRSVPFLSLRGAQRRGISSSFAPSSAVLPTADSSLRSE